MKPRLTMLPNDAAVLMERHELNGMYLVQLLNPAGSIVDKVRCDDYRDACTYRRAFLAIAKNL